LKIALAADLNSVLHVRPQNSSGCLNSLDQNPVTIKSGKRCCSAQKRMYNVREPKQWIIDV